MYTLDFLVSASKEWVNLDKGLKDQFARISPSIGRRRRGYAKLKELKGELGRTRRGALGKNFSMVFTDM